MTKTALYVVFALLTAIAIGAGYLYFLISRAEKEINRKQTENARAARWKKEDETKNEDEKTI